MTSLESTAKATGASPPGGIAPTTRSISAILTLRALMELTKPGITKLVLVTTGVGFALAALGSELSPLTLTRMIVFCLIGTALSSSSANALNQWWERRRDALMPRTCARPLPTERLTARAAASFGILCGVLGVAILASMVSFASASVALATILLYVLMYTPMKPMTTASTIVGAVPGALPPVIGWAAVATVSQTSQVGAGSVEGVMSPPFFNFNFETLTVPAPWSLFAIMFVWQIPHFLAIAWMHREGYARGGFRVLPLVDPDGTRTARAALAWLLALIPISLTPALFLPDRLGWGYTILALILGVFFLRPAILFFRKRDRTNARKLFFGSIIYLPLLLLAMVVDAMVTTFLL